MSVITKGKTFANGEQLTAGKLNQMLDAAVFSSVAVDVTPSKIFNSAAVDVTPSRMFNSAAVDVIDVPAILSVVAFTSPLDP